MASKIKLKNNINSEFTVTHEDNQEAISVSSTDLAKVVNYKKGINYGIN